MGDSWKYYAKLKNQVMKDHMLYDSVYIKYLE